MFGKSITRNIIPCGYLFVYLGSAKLPTNQHNVYTLDCQYEMVENELSTPGSYYQVPFVHPHKTF